MRLRIPHRDLDESLTPATIAALTKTLDAEDRLVTRELFRRLALAGAKRVGDAVWGLEQLNDAEQKSLIRELRRATKREAPEEANVIRIGGGWSPWQLCPICGCQPVNDQGVPVPVAVKRWHCEAHRSEAAPGDLDVMSSGIKLSPAGVPVPIDEGELAREQAEAEMRRRRHEQELAARKVEAERMAREQELRDAAFHAELTEAFR